MKKQKQRPNKINKTKENKENHAPKTNRIITTFKLFSSFSAIPVLLQILGVLFLIISASGQANASLTQNTRIQINRGNQPQPSQLYNHPTVNTSYALYEVHHFATQTYEIELQDLTSDIIQELEANCATISMWKTICSDDPKSCQLSKEKTQTSEAAITMLTQTLFSVTH